MKLLILLFLIKEINCFNSILNQWNCIGITNEINFKKPYKCNIGDIPLVVWKNKMNETISTINICKHLSSTLDKGNIENGCLVCPYHGLKHSKTDSFGIVKEHDGKLWWSMDTDIKCNPPTIPFQYNENFMTSYLQIDMNEDLPYCAYNSMDLHHPEYVHNSLFGFGSNIKPTNFNVYKYPKKTGISFEYYLKNNIKKISYDVQLKDKSSTYNFNMFEYPSSTWSCVQIGNKFSKMIVGVSMLPIKKNKTRWFVTVRHNYMNNFIGKHIVKIMTSLILYQDYMQFNKQSTNKLLKDKYLMNKILEHDEPLLILKQYFSSYKYPTIKDII